MAKGLRTQYWKKGKKLFASRPTNRGGASTITFTPESFDPINNVVYATEHRQYRSKGKHGMRIYNKVYKAKIVNGEIRLGREVAGTSKKVREFEFQHTGDSRLEMGFDSLMSGLKFGGIPQDQIDYLYKMWNDLTPTQKRAFYGLYGTSALVMEYGSDTINEYKVDFSDDNAYYELIKGLLTEVWIDWKKAGTHRW